MAFCGPKLSLCTLIISIWGIIQLVNIHFNSICKIKSSRGGHLRPCSITNIGIYLQTLMGVFYYIHSVALIEDLPLHEHYADPNVFYQEADAAYSQVNAYEIKNFYKT